MFNTGCGKDKPFAVLFLCRSLCICAAWVQVATALLGEGAGSDAPIAGLALIPSAPRPPVLVPSASVTSKPSPSGSIPSQSGPSGLTQSQPTPPGSIPSSLTSSALQSDPISSASISSPPPSEFIPSAPVSSPPPSEFIPSTPVSSDSTGATSGNIPSFTDTIFIPILSETFPITRPNVSVTKTQPSMGSSDEPLRPIPAPTTAPGDPDGHHEIPEPNFTATLPCRGCSPIIEVPATGWQELPSTPIAEHAEKSTTPASPPEATITAGPSNVIIKPEPSNGGFVIGGSTTVTPGQTVIIDKTPVVIRTTAGRTEVIVGTQTIPLKPSMPNRDNSQITEAPILGPVTIGKQIISATSRSQYVVSGQTLAPGGPAITVDRTTLSLLPSATAVVVNGATSAFAQPYAAITVGAHAITAGPVSQYVVSGQTLMPGGPAITVDGTTLSLLPSATGLVVNGATSTFGQPYAAITLGAQTISANSLSQYVISGQTLIAGGPAITVDGSTISLLPSAMGMVVNGATSTFAQPYAALTIGAQTISANAFSQYVISGQTLTPGGPAITVDGTTISLLPSATAIVVNGITTTLAQAYGAIYTTTTHPLLTLNGKVYTANRAGYYVLAPGTTLIPGGPPVTISGTVISVAPHGTEAIIQGSTSFMAPVTTIVTLTRGGGYGGEMYSSEMPGSLPYPTAKPNAAGVAARLPTTGFAGAWLESVFLLGCMGVGWLAVWL